MTGFPRTRLLEEIVAGASAKANGGRDRNGLHSFSHAFKEIKSMRLLLIAVMFASEFPLAAFAGCSMENVSGTYGYVGFGTIGTNPFGLPAGTYSSVGTLAFDGKGSLLITDTARINDFFLTPNATYSGTYTVDKECVGTFTITGFVNAGVPGPHFKFVFVDNRKGIRTISLIPGWIVDYVNTARIDGGNQGG